ncbi:MAG TPA: AAA family ATPase, partial [Candidatus Eisenbacteria bacterium]|nr:AAA family ATPase [Candidatus Eisenbacteria bacterium]
LAPPAAASGSLSTFLLTDIEGSTRRWEEQADAMGAALAVHDRLLRSAIESSDGTVIKTTGDGMLAVFNEPVAAVAAALLAQRSLRDAAWGPTGALRVRIAIHSGTAESRDGDFFGPALNRDARILAIGHGGQILLSAAAAVLTRDRLPADVELVDLGSHRLRDLDRPEQVFQVRVADLPRDFPPLLSLSATRSNLPVQLTSFVGREQERAQVEALVDRARLVTLIGTGGTGKTRLMLEAAGEIAARFPDGVWLAELAPLGDTGQIAPEIARAIGAPEVPGRPALETVAEFLAAKDLLLLLDNAEHLIDGVAHVVSRLLAAAPGLRILTTSREALAVSGEAVVQVPSLSCPPAPVASRPGTVATALDLDAAAGTEAVRLFSERAAATLPSFELSAGNIGAVTEICRRLDGIPLAIELAAARVSAMSPEDIAVGLSDRFRMLTGGRRTAVPRQQTLQALIGWSWDLLTEDDRRLLRRLSVFSGSWTAAAAARAVGVDEVPGAAEVAGSAAASAGPAEVDAFLTLDGLTRLVDRSLVLVDRGATTRYRMLETIRQYARERLIESGEANVIADRHFDYFAALAGVAAVELHGPAMVDWLDRLDAEAENLGSALEWGLESTPEAAVQMCIAMLAYWRLRVASPDTEARVVAATVVARQIAERPAATAAQRALAARLLGDAAAVWGVSGHAGVAMGWGGEAIELARSGDDRSALIAALTGRSIAAVFSGARDDMREVFDEVLRLATEAGDWWTVATAGGGMASGLRMIDPVAAEALLGVAIDAARRISNPYAIAMSAWSQGQLLSGSGRTDEAERWFDEAIGRFAELGDERFALATRSELAHAMRRGGRLEEAVAAYRETIPAWIRVGNRGAIANQLENVAFLAIEQGHGTRAARLLGAAESLREAASSPMTINEEPEYREWVARLRASAPGAEIDAAWRVGRAISPADAAALATAADPAEMARDATLNA